jgi:hypothetical protein
MSALLARGRPITLDDPAGVYLHARTGIIDFPDCLRFAPDERYADPGTRPSRHPVMLARVEPCDAARAEGEPDALHRTYLDCFGNRPTSTPSTRCWARCRQAPRSG